MLKINLKDEHIRMHIQPISHYPPHERIKILKILKRQGDRLVELPRGYCIKPKTSECNKSVSMPL